MSRPEPRIRTPLGPFALIHPGWLAFKGACAALVAYGLCQLTGCRDVVSAVFVAVLCTSPILLVGLRQALAQLAGSLLGGLLGILMLALAVPEVAGIPLAIGLAMWACFRVHFPQGYPVAAFSALIVQVLPAGTPLDALEVRMLAVAIAGASGFVVNLVFSARAYREIFSERLRRVEEHADKLLVDAAEQGPRAVHPGFELLNLMESELAQAREELDWRRDEEGAAWLRRIAARVYGIHHLLHLVYDLGLLLEDHRLEHSEVRPFLEWTRCGEGERPRVPEPLIAAADRIAALWHELHERVPDPD